MKINLIIPTFYPAVIYGGPIFSTLNTCKELVKFSDIDLKVSTTNANMDSYLDVEINQFIEIEDKIFVKYYHDTKINKLSIPLLLSIWKDIKSSEIIHIQSIFNLTIPISLFYAKIFHKPVVLSPRGSFAPWILNRGKNKKDIWLKYLIKPFVKNVTWHATAEQEKIEIQNIYPNAKVSIIPNGIYLDDYKTINTLSKKEYIKKFTRKDIEAENIIISMGRIHAKKGFDILIKSFSMLKEVSKSILLIAGDDETELKNLISLTKQLRLEDRVFFIGSVSGQDKVDFLANADLFVLPSHNENFGNVYAESLGAGTPIIASTNTPWQEVEDYLCGLWVENSIENTKKAMGSLLQEDLIKMGKNGQEYIKKYEWKNIAKSFYDLFNDILEKK